MLSCWPIPIHLRVGSKVPQNDFRGGPWELVTNDLFGDEPYYRQPLPAGGEIPEAFTVKVGEQWAASMPTHEWMAISLNNQFRDGLPSFVEPVFPYKIVNNLFLRGSEGAISLLAHESFHAYQGMVAPEGLEAAETAVAGAESRYRWTDPTLQASWQTELDLLATAVETEAEAEMVELAQQFLTQRARRRQESNLNQELIEYEARREWLEGLARYVELEIWRQAAGSESYEPIPAIWADPDFAGYATYDRRWSQEIDQIRRMAKDEGDGRFYYSGMAQAVLLDRLMPGWQGQVFDEGVFLEDLLETAVSSKNNY